MTEAAVAGHWAIRLAFFVGIFVIMALWEVLAPRRSGAVGRAVRWPSNLGLAAVNTGLLRILNPAAAVGLALLAEERGWGLLTHLGLPGWWAVVLSVVILDLAIYFQHVLFHAVPLLWRLHRVHHADLDFDVTTGVRFHPVEIILSMGIKLVLVAALGPPAIAVLIFEVVLNGTSLFNHSNVRLAPSVDHWLRWLVVTPDMHRVHHSVVPRETNSNFGFNLPWWDRMFGTYRAQPAAGHEGMAVGVAQFRAVRELRLDRMLMQPLRGKTGDYTMNPAGKDI